jgi:uncharacterized protein
MKRESLSVTVAPRVEDLLASIRRAIDEEDTAETRNATVELSAASTSMNEHGKLARGSMREMRVSIDEASTVSARNAEIDGIRAKVDRSFAEAVNNRPVKMAAGGGKFSNIMAGQQPRRERPEPADHDETGAADYPALRDTILQSAADYGDEPAPPPPRYYRAEPAPQPESSWNARSGTLMSQQSTQSAQASFDRLADTIMTRLGGDRTLEDITRELLRGMLRHWLDENLPALVENLVREEIERVARRGR